MLRKNLVNQRFGKLLVIERGPSDKRSLVRWLCKCDCGNVALVLSCNLLSNHSKSCGCYKVEKAKDDNTTHGKSGTSEHRIWHLLSNKWL